MATSGKTWTIEAEIMPKQGVNDPQGEAVNTGLRQLGFDGIDRVRVGKIIRIDINAGNEDEARSTGREMCERLLANPVIEEFKVTVLGSGKE